MVGVRSDHRTGSPKEKRGRGAGRAAEAERVVAEAARFERRGEGFLRAGMGASRVVRYLGILIPEPRAGKAKIPAEVGLPVVMSRQS
jgi:hypothetical protein